MQASCFNSMTTKLIWLLAINGNSLINTYMPHALTKFIKWIFHVLLLYVVVIVSFVSLPKRGELSRHKNSIKHFFDFISKSLKTLIFTTLVTCSHALKATPSGIPVSDPPPASKYHKS